MADVHRSRAVARKGQVTGTITGTRTFKNSDSLHTGCAVNRHYATPFCQLFLGMVGARG